MTDKSETRQQFINIAKETNCTIHGSVATFLRLAAEDKEWRDVLIEALTDTLCQTARKHNESEPTANDLVEHILTLAETRLGVDIAVADEEHNEEHAPSEETRNDLH